MQLEKPMLSAEMPQTSTPVGGRSPGLCSVLSTALPRVWTCPPRCAWQRTLWCADRVSCAPRRGKVQCAVGVPIPAAIEPVPNYFSRRGFDGRDSAEAGERGLTLQALGVVPGHTQQRRCMVRTDTQKSGQLRGGIRHQPIQLLIQLGDLFGELLVAPCPRAQRELRGRLHVTRSSSGTQTPTGVDQILGRELAQTVA